MKKTYVSESGHWYTKDGLPAYTIKGKNGKERNTTLRDARKEGLVPSVTTIIREAPKPGLEAWKRKNILESALTLPRTATETDAEFVARVMEDADTQASKARERGIEIHKWIQQGLEGAELEGEAYNYYILAMNTIEAECGKQTWHVERSFATKKYGGKIDLYCPDFLLDTKTKETPEGFKIWDEHAMQIAPYQKGISHKGKGGILFISTTSLDAKIIWIKPEELIRGWKMFMGILDFWYAKTGLE